MTRGFLTVHENFAAGFSAAMISVHEEIRGFKVLPIRVPVSRHLSKVSGEKEILHFIYLKPHQSKFNNNEDLDEKSIFIINLPKDITIKGLRGLFKQVSESSIVQELTVSNSLSHKDDVDLSKLTSEYFDSKNTELTASKSLKLPVNTALVTFVDKAAMKLFMSNLKQVSRSKSQSSLPQYKYQEINASGFIQKFKDNIYDVETLKQSINVALTDFNIKEADEMQALQESAAIIDEDGFQLVVGKHRKTKAAILGKTSHLKLSNNSELQDDLAKRQQKKEKQDFYRFQIREKKKQEMNDLLLKFREDQLRIKLMREKKKFRPY